MHLKSAGDQRSLSFQVEQSIWAGLLPFALDREAATKIELGQNLVTDFPPLSLCLGPSAGKLNHVPITHSTERAILVEDLKLLTESSSKAISWQSQAEVQASENRQKR